MTGAGAEGEKDPSTGQSRLKAILLCSFCRSSSLFSEVMQMNFEIASFSSLSGTQPIAWQVEYPRRATTDSAVSEIFISQKDLAGIVPLATVRAVWADGAPVGFLLAQDAGAGASGSHSIISEPRLPSCFPHNPRCNCVPVCYGLPSPLVAPVLSGLLFPVRRRREATLHIRQRSQQAGHSKRPQRFRRCTRPQRF